MIFTQAQIQDMLSIMSRYQLTFIATQLGPAYLSPADKAILLAAGIDVNKYKNSGGIIEHAFLFGILADAIGDDRAKKMDYPQFQKFIASKNFIPLTKEEEYALQQVKNRAYTDITNLGARMRSAVSNSVIRNNQQQSLAVQKMIREKTIKAVELRSGARALAADLANTSKDWEVDWLRIAYYLTHEAYNAGRAQSILKQHGADAEVYFDVYPGACKSCKKLYLEDPDDPDSKPIVFKLDEIIANGNNIGRKTADWKPTISPTHPYCFNSEKTKIYTSKGWRNISEIRVGDLVLTHKGRFRRVTQTIKHEYNGEDLFNITYRNSDNSKFVVRRITGNHPVFTSRGWIQVSELFSGDKVFNSSLLCSDCGKKINIQINNSNLLKEQLCLNCLRKKNAKKQWKSEEFRAFISDCTKEQMKERYSQMSFNERKTLTIKARETIKEKYGSCHPWMKDAIKKANKTNGKKRTYIEKKLLYFCEQLGVEAVSNVCLRNRCGLFRNDVVCYFPDIFIPKLGIVLEADGENWHKDKTYDVNRDKDIKDFFGFDTFRFSEEDIRNNGEEVFEELKRIFNNHSKKYCLNKCEVINIQRVRKNSKCDYLYNLSVEEDESYIADGLIVHNCRCTINYKDPDLEWDADLRAFVKVKKKTSTNPRLQGVKLNIKVTKGIDQETEDMLQKAHIQGDIHPNGKWYWESSAAGGKGDWRVIKKTVTPIKQKSKFAELTEEEMMADYDRLDGLDNASKKELSKKYSIESNKAAEIGAEILRGIQEKRKAKDAFTKEDLRWFRRLYPSTGTFATLKKALDAESEAFVKFVADEYKKVYDKVMGQRLHSLADKARITDYNNIVRYLNEKKNSEDKGLQNLIKNLTVQTDAFKTKYINDTEQYATAVWERSRDKYSSAEDEAIQLRNNHGIPYSEKKDRLKELSEIMKKYSIARQEKSFFVGRIVTDAKKTFEADIRNIADHIRQKGIDESKIQVKPLKVGSVGIDMMIGDEKRALYARAIIAAMNSMYMRPHYRFIITEKDDYKSWQS